MVVANFGMGIRPSSSVVQTDDEIQNQFSRFMSDLQNQQSTLQASLQDRATDLARRNVANTVSLGYNLTEAQQANLIKRITPAYLQEADMKALRGSPWQNADGFGQTDFYRQRQEYDRLQNVLRQQEMAPKAFEAQQRDRLSAQTSQQDAYNQSFGSAGGVLGRTSQAGMNDPTQPTASMPWGQPWSTPGFGNPGSLGGLGGYKPSAQQGWGSVFGGGRNPWSLA